MSTSSTPDMAQINDLCQKAQQELTKLYDWVSQTNQRADPAPDATMLPVKHALRTYCAEIKTLKSHTKEVMSHLETAKELTSTLRSREEKVAAREAQCAKSLGIIDQREKNLHQERLDFEADQKVAVSQKVSSLEESVSNLRLSDEQKKNLEEEQRKLQTTATTLTLQNNNLRASNETMKHDNLQLHASLKFARSSLVKVVADARHMHRIDLTRLQNLASAEKAAARGRLLSLATRHEVDRSRWEATMAQKRLDLLATERELDQLKEQMMTNKSDFDKTSAAHSLEVQRLRDESGEMQANHATQIKEAEKRKADLIEVQTRLDYDKAQLLRQIDEMKQSTSLEVHRTLKQELQQMNDQVYALTSGHKAAKREADEQRALCRDLQLTNSKMHTDDDLQEVMSHRDELQTQVANQALELHRLKTECEQAKGRLEFQNSPASNKKRSAPPPSPLPKHTTEWNEAVNQLCLFMKEFTVSSKSPLKLTMYELLRNIAGDWGRCSYWSDYLECPTTEKRSWRCMHSIVNHGFDATKRKKIPGNESRCSECVEANRNCLQVISQADTIKLQLIKASASASSNNTPRLSDSARRHNVVDRSKQIPKTPR